MTQNPNVSDPNSSETGYIPPSEPSDSTEGLTQAANAPAEAVSGPVVPNPTDPPLSQPMASPSTSNGVVPPESSDLLTSPDPPDYSVSSPDQSFSRPTAPLVAASAILIILVGFILNNFWLTLAGSMVALAISLRIIWPSWRALLAELSPQQRSLLIAIPGVLLGGAGLMHISGLNGRILQWGKGIRWDVVGSLGDFFGAFGQILIAGIAVYVAWRQYVISRDLTTQQNRITQQQTIDSYFQGISDLVLDEEGLLEDWPQERAIAEARTAAILSSVDAIGKAKVIRFLSRSRLLSPLKRDRRLGRPILDGAGGYAEDRDYGVRVIDLGVMLAASNLSGADLRWTDLSAANLIRANLDGADLVRANLVRTILVEASLKGADIMGARFFYGSVESASPRSRKESANYATGAFTGAVVEGADFSNAQRMSENQRQYCCAWGGTKTRSTIPGGCEGIPNRLDR